MDIIKLLPEHIANQIAAGEVIQRPSSAVKEIIENSIDAGATQIELIIKDAGKTLIQVVDNGCGMSKTDAKISFERHATSKIRKADDLFNIKSMGFRGEAMASIAAISHVELNTKTTNSELGSKVIIEGSEIKSQESCVCPTGTSIKIKNLFYNVPARRNFLKSDKIENKHITNEFTRVSLANPEILFILKIDNNIIYRLEPSNFRQRIVSILGSKTNEKLVPIIEETTLVKISGFIGKPEFAKRTRGEQYFFVNGRYIKNYYLNHAINKAYAELISDNSHPSYFINLSINPKQIDINIHPTKTEINFEDDKAIYAILISSVKRSLGKDNIAPTLDFNTEPSFEIPINHNKIIKEPKIRVDRNYNPFVNKKEEILNSQKLYENILKEDVNSEIKLFETEFYNFFQINNQFIICQGDEGLIIVHQERAHHRILFEYFKQKKSKKIPSQKLIFPKHIFISKQQSIEINLLKKEFSEMGFDLKVNEESIEINGIPSQCREENLQNIVEDILNNLDIEDENIDEKIKNKLNKNVSYSLCLKTGQKLTTEEMKVLVNELMNCEISSVSPNGSSTFINLNLNDINKKFNL